MSSELVDILAGATLDFFAANRELEHNSAVLALFFPYFGRWHLVHCLASGALHLLWASNELKHGPAVVANEVRSGHRWDSGRN